MLTGWTLRESDEQGTQRPQQFFADSQITPTGHAERLHPQQCFRVQQWLRTSITVPLSRVRKTSPAISRRETHKQECDSLRARNDLATVCQLTLEVTGPRRTTLVSRNRAVRSSVCTDLLARIHFGDSFAFPGSKCSS
jgi:hypothetical protein